MILLAKYEMLKKTNAKGEKMLMLLFLCLTTKKKN